MVVTFIHYREGRRNRLAGCLDGCNWIGEVTCYNTPLELNWVCFIVFTMKWVEESGNKSKLGNIMYLHILGWFAIMTESEYSWECFCGCLHHICSLAFLSGCIEITHISHPTKATWRCMYDWNKTVNVHCTKRICGMFAARKYPKMYAFDESMSLLLQEE